MVVLAASAGVARATDPPPSARVSYVAFPTLHGVPLTVAGRLMVPRRAQGKVPAVLIVHGSAGLDSRGPLMAEALIRAGIATLKMHSGATHKFDGTEPEHVFQDPAANLGRGGEVRATPNLVAAALAREATVRFFSEVFGLNK